MTALVTIAVFVCIAVAFWAAMNWDKPFLNKKVDWDKPLFPSVDWDKPLWNWTRLFRPIRSVVALIRIRHYGPVVAKLVAAGMLLAAITEQDRDYFTILRWVVFAVSGFSAFDAAIRKKVGWAWILATIALAFNPAFPVHLQRETWAFVDVAAAVLLLISIAAIDRREPRP